jgi:sphingomyelin phosphodiesterase acid-like 3
MLKPVVRLSIQSWLRVGFGGLLAACGMAGLLAVNAFAETKTVAQVAAVDVVMLSDLHLDPFHDPAKVTQLVKAPVEEWAAILRSPDSATQEADFAAVQKACKAKQLTDAPYALLASSLKAAKAQAGNARFVTVSGDLLVHDLDCRYRAALKLPKSTTDDESLSAAFAAKTTVFVMKRVEQVFAGIPVYLALGNNDSRCNHNRMDVQDAYLKATAEATIDGLIGVSAAERKLALTTYESGGYYAVTMAAPMQNTRLLVLDDIYMMSRFANCEADESDQKGAQEQLAWLTGQLDRARQKGERVWVLGHVPPTVNPRGTLANAAGLCAGGEVDGYLSSDALANALVGHADVVKLALFGHTHMDELHLLGSGDAGVPLKVVASISPVSGNIPSFTVGKVSPASAMLMDYTVFEASNTTGVDTTWPKEYDFKETYGEAAFSAKTVADLIGRLRADTSGTGTESLAYQTHFFKGHSPIPLGPLWEGYVCSLDHGTAEGFRTCVCGAK